MWLGPYRGLTVFQFLSAICTKSIGCSSHTCRTMDDDAVGLFQEWFSTISSILKQSGRLKEISSQFGKLRSDEDRVSFGLSLACVHDVMTMKPSFKPKSATESTKLRNEGNKLYQKNRYHEALKVYSRSILSAPFDSNGRELSLAFANSSAVLFHLKDYSQCLQGIQPALSHNYPEELRYKLFDRQGKCFIELGNNDKALECFNKAKQALNDSKLDYSKKEIWSKDLEKEICECQRKEIHKSEMPGDHASSNESFLKRRFELPQLTHGSSSKFLSASCAFDVAASQVTGRHPVATRDVYVGDILVIEKPFASVLLPRHLETHCYHCLRRATNIPIPCCQCSTVRYCSEACAKQSWDSCHSIECQYLDLIHQAGLGGNDLLALRIVAKAGYKCLMNFRQKLQQGLCNVSGRDSGCREEGTYNSEDYLPIYCLVTHSDDRSMSDLFRRTMISVFLLKILQGGGFFDGEACSQNDLAFIGSLILRHLQSNPCNAHEVSELQLNLNSVATSETDEIAAGIYATLSLFNHCCDPSVTRNFYGDTCVVRAIKNIPKGQEISDNYGSLCALSVKAERHEKLRSQYYFTCHCVACEEDFPLYSDIPITASRVFKCEKCRTPLRQATGCAADHVRGHVANHGASPVAGHMSSSTKGGEQSAECPKCQHTYNLSEMRATLNASEDLYQKAMDSLLLKADAEGNVAVLEAHLRLLEKMVCRPWKDFNNCQEAIKQCYSIMGNCHVMR